MNGGGAPDDSDPRGRAAGDGEVGVGTEVDGTEMSGDGTVEGGDAGPDGEAVCEVTPVSGAWLGSLADPTMLLLERTEEGISG